MPNPFNDATRMLGVVGSVIEKSTKSGAGIDVTYGQVAGVSAGLASVYLAGSRELAISSGEIPEPSEEFLIPSHLNVSASDYVRVSMDSRGHRWINDVLPNSVFSKISLDANTGRILAGDGSVMDTASGRGGAGFMYVPVLLKAGNPADGDFASAPPNGSFAINTSTGKLWYKNASGTWVATT